MRTWILPERLLTSSVSIMAPHGRCGNEGLALWLGREEGEAARVTHVLNLSGPGFRSGPLQLQLSERAMARITDIAADLDTFLVGQIHSHPGNFIELSHVDKVYGIRIESYLSLVCPQYAQVPNTNWRECGFHVFEGVSYRGMKPSEIAARVHFDARTVDLVNLGVPE